MCREVGSGPLPSLGTANRPEGTVTPAEKWEDGAGVCRKPKICLWEELGQEAEKDTWHLAVMELSFSG